MLITRILPACGLAALLSACSLVDRSPAACELLSPDEIGSALQVTSVRQESGPGSSSPPGTDTCRWTADGASLELRLYRANDEGAWKLVFESAKVHATKPDAEGRVRAHTVSGTGDEAMFLPGSGGDASMAFRVGRSGGVLAGRASEAVLVDLAKRAAGRL